MQYVLNIPPIDAFKITAISINDDKYNITLDDGAEVALDKLQFAHRKPMDSSTIDSYAIKHKRPNGDIAWDVVENNLFESRYTPLI